MSTTVNRYTPVFRRTEGYQNGKYQPTLLKDAEGPVVLHEDYQKLQQKHDQLQAALQSITDLAEAWDEKGATKPQHPLSWESAGRLALDEAKAALKGEQE